MRRPFTFDGLIVNFRVDEGFHPVDRALLGNAGGGADASFKSV
jgi:hypothetical protein